jgi:hypothetical protein
MAYPGPEDHHLVSTRHHPKVRHSIQRSKLPHMRHGMISLKGLSVALMFTGLLGLAGCADDGLAKRYSVSGKVTYKGQPVANGLINFIAEASDGRSATGMIENGYYKLTTQDTNDGAFPGKYTVTIVAKTPDLVEAEAKAKAKGSTAAYIPQDFTAAAHKTAKNAVPDKYSVLETSPYKGTEVKAQSNTFDFDLKD